MSCHELLKALRDHAAGAEPTPGLAAHLGDCRSCADALEAERRLLAEIEAVIGAVREREPSPALLGRARSLAEASPSPRRSGMGAWAAAAVLLLGLAALVQQRAAWAPTSASLPRAPASPPQAPLVALRPLTAPSAPASARTGPASPFDQPVVPPGQEAALVRLAELVTSGVVEPPPQLLDPDEPAVPIPEPLELDRPPLTIAPIRADEVPSEE